MQGTFQTIDPLLVAEQQRKLMFDSKKKRFFIADFIGSNMIKDNPDSDRFFRVRRYIKSRDLNDYCQEWLEVSSSEIWSTRFVGISDNGFQKLEFQNPPYVAAHRMGGDPRQYNDTFVIHSNGCDYKCSFCYVDDELNEPEFGKGKFFSKEEIMDEFLRIRIEFAKKGKELNVIRLSGGETTCLVPELIVELFDELENRNLLKDVYVWADCNLSTLHFIRNLTGELKEIMRKKNFGIVGCLKAIGNGHTGKFDFAKITKAKPEYFSKQFEALDFLVNELRADTYVYLIPIIFGKREIYEKRLEECANRLMDINKNLPLRANILYIRKYTPVEKNIRTAFEEGRPLPNFDNQDLESWYGDFIQTQKNITKIWHNKILPKFFKSTEISRYRCQIHL